MRKLNFLFIVLFVSTFKIQSQEAEIKTELPIIMGPSPTVAALMKFEEVPVNNYTGVPDISIPLFSSPTHSKDIKLDISLKYAPSGVAANERASDVGLGWSLFAGGTISRTVRGIPDEYNRLSSGKKLGIYRSLNNYDQAIEIINDENASPTEYEIGNEYLWNTQVKGEFDTEYDLWQFNFMGYTGRFYIKKMADGLLEVKPLDDYRLKIINHYDSISYVHDGFTVYDEKGYRYIFDIVESTDSNSLTTTYSYTEMGPITTLSSTIQYRSAFHLSEIYDNNGNQLVVFNYQGSEKEEITIDTSQTENLQAPIHISTGYTIDYVYNEATCGSYKKNFNPLPKNISVSSQRKTTVKKLSKILVNDIAIINFSFVRGREDTNLHNPDSTYVLKQLTIQNWNEETVKKISLEHSYSTLIDTRMLLDKVSFANLDNSKTEDYNLEYRVNNDHNQLIGKDYWGYFNLRPSHFIGGDYRKTTPDFCTSDILQKMTLPTGGSIVYDFESNKFSFIGNTVLTDFDDNPENWIFEDTVVALTTHIGTKENFFTIADEQMVYFDATIETETSDWWITIFKVAGSGFDSKGGLNYDTCMLQNCTTGIILEPGTYKVSLFSYDTDFIDNINNKVTAYYKIRASIVKKYQFGGGIRIGRIAYFDQNVDKEYFQVVSNQIVPAKIRNYTYDLLTDNSKSSGSLVFDIPKFEYQKQKRECYWCDLQNAMYLYPDDETVFFYDVRTSFNNLQSLRTQGADVGYKNVSIFESGNGRTDYEYKTAFDHPENVTTFNLSPPFLPTENYDYKRGLLVKETIYNNQNQPLKESSFVYDLDEFVEVTGFKTFYHTGEFQQGFQSYSSYSDYHNFYTNCGQYPAYMCPDQYDNNPNTNGDCNCFCYNGAVQEFVGFKNVKEAFGWAKLSTKTTKDYFYDGTAQKFVQTDETFDYNPLNKKIASHTTTGSDNIIYQTDYTYHDSSSLSSENRISEIESITNRRDSEAISIVKSSYKKLWSIDGTIVNPSFLPWQVLAAKDGTTLISKLRYRKYDEFSNVLQVEQESGMPVSYIYGYNKTLPVAKIENINYEEIPVSLIDDIWNATDNPTLLGALDSLRFAPELSGAMVTTYTYKPLVGIESITDPKGISTFYEYDEFGRLQMIRDSKGFIISENEYHYRNQN